MTPIRCSYCHEPVDLQGRCPRACGSVAFRPPSCAVCLGAVDAEGACAARCVERALARLAASAAGEPEYAS